MRSRKWALILATSFVLPMPAVAACSLTHADLPVKIVGLRALIPVTFNGSDATMVVDSGDFYSMLSSASAMALKLKVVASPNISFVRGIRGTASVALTSVDRFVLENIPFNRKVQFLVGGTDAGNDAAGLLGQNILGVDDTEYDLANGMIRLMTPKNCHRQVLAYWAARDKLPVSMVDLENTRGYPSGILSSAFLNGHRILVMFDSGAPLSVLTLHAARRAGITPNSPGVTPAGMAFGVGQSLTRSWIGTFESLKIGQEEIKHTRLRFADISPGDVDMILGMDFFLSHRIYVARSQGRLYFTYNGGPVFNLQSPAAPAKPIAATPLAQRGYSTGISPAKDAAGLAAQGDALLARHEYAQAIASLTQAIRIDAGHPDYFYQRAVAYRATRQAAPALQDLDQALKLEPSYVDALLARAAIELSEKDRDAARADIDAVSHFESDESDRRLALSSFYEALDARQEAIQQLDL